jgi:hypothetical protein
VSSKASQTACSLLKRRPTPRPALPYRLYRWGRSCRKVVITGPCFCLHHHLGIRRLEVGSLEALTCLYALTPFCCYNKHLYQTLFFQQYLQCP